MISDKVYLNHSNKVIIEAVWGGEFSELGWNYFDEVVIEIGDESYSTVTNPSNLYIADDTRLYLDIGTVTALSPSSYRITIRAYNSNNIAGYILTSPVDNVLSDPVRVLS